MTIANDLLQRLTEADDEFPGISAEGGGSVEDELLQARIRRQKNQEFKDLHAKPVRFVVSGFERYAHSPSKQEQVGTMVEAKRLAIQWSKDQSLKLWEISIHKASRPKAWPTEMGNKDEVEVACLKKTLSVAREDEHGHLQRHVKWEWIK